MLISPQQILESFNIDVSKLERNYLEKPLIRINGFYKEYPTEKDLIYLSIEKNLRDCEISIFLNTSEHLIYTLRKKYNLNRTKDLRKKVIERNSLKKYGITSPNKLENKKEKAKQTCLKKYGYICSSKNLEVQQKAKQTCLKKYGYTSPLKSPVIKEKSIETNLRKYGVKSSNSLDWKKEKIRESNLRKYGVRNPSQFQLIKNKKIQTCLKHFGVTNYSKTEEYKKNYKEKINIIQKKINETKRKNNSFVTSIPENKIFNKLQDKYEIVFRNYKSEKYPFNCDFYIPSLDLYIEYNGTWYHGGHPFDPNILEDSTRVELLNKKAKELNYKNELKKSYLYAIEVWTVRDPLKRETACKNGLNYLEFFNEKEFMEWYNKQ